VRSPASRAALVLCVLALANRSLEAQNGPDNDLGHVADLLAGQASEWQRGVVDEELSVDEKTQLSAAIDQLLERIEREPKSRGWKLRAKVGEEWKEKTLKEAREAFERAYILSELRVLDWNMTRTAQKLGIERSHLYRKLKTYGITPPKG